MSATDRTAAARAALRALWFVVIPALLAAAALRYLVPALVTGHGPVVEDALRVGQRFPVPLGVALFLLFAAAGRYWRFSLPGGRYLSAYPAPLAGARDPERSRLQAAAAALDASLRGPRMRGRLERAVSGEALAQLDVHLGELRSGLCAGDERLVVESSRAARALAAPVLARHQRRELVGLVVAIALVAALALVARGRFVESYSVLSGSMLPTLQPDDRLAANRLAYRTWTGAPSAEAPRRGDMIVFKSRSVDDGNLTDVPDYLVKRVIGLPGDRIAMHGSVPVINGWTVPICDAGEYLYVLQGGDNGLDGRLAVEFLDDRAYLTVHTLAAAQFTDTYLVQPGEVFVLGDNRNNSIDSRAYNEHHGGGVPYSGIEARVQWFVAARRADMSWDFGRLFRRVDSLATTLHLDGVNLRPLEEGIEKCLRKRPLDTRPPPPANASQAAP